MSGDGDALKGAESEYESRGFARCRSCGAEIFWTVTPLGKRMPADVDATEAGTMLLLQGARNMLSLVLTEHALEAARREGVQLYGSHFSSCPDAAKWRQQKGMNK